MIRTEGGHFWLTFENGYKLSCFNGYGSHTENNFALEKWCEIVGERNIYKNFWESELIEIAIIYHGEFVTQDIIESEDDVKTIDLKELVNVINIVSNLKGEKQDEQN